MLEVVVLDASEVVNLVIHGDVVQREAEKGYILHLGCGVHGQMLVVQPIEGRVQDRMRS